MQQLPRASFAFSLISICNVAESIHPTNIDLCNGDIFICCFIDNGFSQVKFHLTILLIQVSLLTTSFNQTFTDIKW